jgi:hypothetical protein
VTGGNPTPLHLLEPLTMDEARQASQTLARQRRTAEALFEKAVEEAADAERLYRKGRAQEYAKIAGEGTAAQREAIVDAATADLRYARDLAVGMQKAHQERLRGLEGERSQLRALMSMSERMMS